MACWVVRDRAARSAGRCGPKSRMWRHQTALHIGEAAVRTLCPQPAREALDRAAQGRYLRTHTHERRTTAGIDASGFQPSSARVAMRVISSMRAARSRGTPPASHRVTRWVVPATTRHRGRAQPFTLARAEPEHLVEHQVGEHVDRSVTAREERGWPGDSAWSRAIGGSRRGSPRTPPRRCRPGPLVAAGPRSAATSRRAVRVDVVGHRLEDGVAVGERLVEVALRQPGPGAHRLDGDADDADLADDVEASGEQAGAAIRPALLGVGPAVGPDDCDTLHGDTELARPVVTADGPRERPIRNAPCDRPR